MTLVIILVLGVIALALVALNFALQRLIQPDRGNDSVAGCCSMVLPTEIIQSTHKEELIK